LAPGEPGAGGRRCREVDASAGADRRQQQRRDPRRCAGGGRTGPGDLLVGPGQTGGCPRDRCTRRGLPRRPEPGRALRRRAVVAPGSGTLPGRRSTPRSRRVRPGPAVSRRHRRKGRHPTGKAAAERCRRRGGRRERGRATRSRRHRTTPSGRGRATRCRRGRATRSGRHRTMRSPTTSWRAGPLAGQGLRRWQPTGHRPRVGRPPASTAGTLAPARAAVGGRVGDAPTPVPTSRNRRGDRSARRWRRPAHCGQARPDPCVAGPGRRRPADHDRPGGVRRRSATAPTAAGRRPGATVPPTGLL
jgi:hypothetical protein